MYLLPLILSLIIRPSATIPVITSFTGPSTAIQGQTISLCWTVSNTPTSITITPGTNGNQTTTYVDSSNPISGCANFTPPTPRLRMDGDSLTCGFRASGAAQNTFNSALPCSYLGPNPNGSICCAWPARAFVNLQQAGYATGLTWTNLGVVGALAAGHTATTCTSTIYNPDILAVNFGANDLQGVSTNPGADTFYTNIKSLWASARSSGCKVVTATVTPRTNFTESVRVYANGLITGTPSLYDAIMDIGNTSDVMGCAGCNVTATTYYNSDNTHYSNLGYQHAGDLWSTAVASLMRATYSITATNGSGTSSATTLLIPVYAPQRTVVTSGIIK